MCRRLTAWRFTSLDLVRARRLREIESVFDANAELAALVVDLSEEVARLRRRLHVLELPVNDDAVRDAGHVEAGAAVFHPFLRHGVELLRRHAQHLRRDDEARARFLLVDEVVDAGHGVSF
eukprot:gene6667-7749_t